MKNFIIKKDWLGYDIFPIYFTHTFPSKKECRILAKYWLKGIKDAENNTPCLHICCPNSIDMLLELQEYTFLVVSFFRNQEYLTCAVLDYANEYEEKCKMLLDI